MDSVSGDTLSDIIRTVSVSDGFFKHQQKDDPDLTVEEKSKIQKWKKNSISIYNNIKIF